VSNAYKSLLLFLVF